MEKVNFSDIGRIGAIEALLEKGGFGKQSRTSFLAPAGSVVRTASRIWLEGIDFDLTYFPLRHLGYKSIVGTVGILYAELAKPMILSVRMGVSAKLDYEQVREIWEGMSAAAKEHNIPNVDLDLSPSRNGLTISIYITGYSDSELSERRKSVKSKDLICISGNLGSSYLGMTFLENEKARLEKNKDVSGTIDIDRYKMIVGNYVKPEINPDSVAKLKESGISPAYGYLVDKGLADAVKRLNRDCGLGVKIYSDKIPFEGNSFELGKRLNVDPMSAAMNGGDDFRLMYVIPMSMYEMFRHDLQSFSIIGHLAKKDVGTVIVMPEGAELPIHAQGWKEE